MKKLFILTILLSAKLMSAAVSDESHAMLTAAQKEHRAHLAKATESSARLNTLQQAASQNPTPENIAALHQHISEHNQTVDHCKQCVHGIQNTLKEINAKGDYVHGDAFKGRVAPRV